MRVRPSPRTTALLAAAIALLLGVGVIAAAGTGTESAGAAPTASALGTITDQTVVYKVELAGTLHRDGQSSLVYGVRVAAPAPAATSGAAARGGAGVATPNPTTAGATTQRSILTALASPGLVVSQGQQLWTVDAKPTVLLYGDTAAYRVLSVGVADGSDVQELEADLTALGFTDGGAVVVDSHFDGTTAEAVKEWQTSLGVDTTGSVSPVDVVFTPARAGCWVRNWRSVTWSAPVWSSSQ